jgi:hypothetical protein
MDNRQFLQLPIRLRHRHAGFLERLAELGPLCHRVGNLAVEMAAMADTSGAVLCRNGVAWMPSVALSFVIANIAGVHALPADQPDNCCGVIEVDLIGERHPIRLAVPSDAKSVAALRRLVADFCVREVNPSDLLEWRAVLSRPFEPCACCKAAMKRRRDQAETHPLVPIFADAADGGLDLHCRVGGVNFALERFLIPARLNFDGAVTVHDCEEGTLLRVDPALTHSVTITVVASDGEARSLVRVHDLLGKEALTFSAAGAGHVARWRRHCAGPAR